MCSSWLGKEGREIAAQSQDQNSVLDEKGLIGGSAEVQDCSQEVKSGNISRTSQCSLSGLWVLILWTWLFINTFYLVFGNFILVCDVSCISHSFPLPSPRGLQTHPPSDHTLNPLGASMHTHSTIPWVMPYQGPQPRGKLFSLPQLSSVAYSEAWGLMSHSNPCLNVD